MTLWEYTAFMAPVGMILTFVMGWIAGGEWVRKRFTFKAPDRPDGRAHVLHEE